MVFWWVIIFPVYSDKKSNPNSIKKLTTISIHKTLTCPKCNVWFNAASTSLAFGLHFNFSFFALEHQLQVIHIYMCGGIFLVIFLNSFFDAVGRDAHVQITMVTLGCVIVMWWFAHELPYREGIPLRKERSKRLAKSHLGQARYWHRVSMRGIIDAATNDSSHHRTNDSTSSYRTRVVMRST